MQVLELLMLKLLQNLLLVENIMKKNLFGRVLYKVNDYLYINLTQVTAVYFINNSCRIYLSNDPKHFVTNVSVGEDILRAMRKL